MNNFLNDLSQIAKKSNNTNTSNVSPFISLYMKVNDIRTEHNITYAYGLDLINRNYVRVRLNSVDEGANDLIITKRASNIAQATNMIQHLYNGPKPRESLDKKKSKRHAQYLFFERAVYLDVSPDNVPTFRAHWSAAITQLEDVEMVIGHINIQHKPQRKVGDRTDKERAHAQVIEFMRPFNLGEPEKNLKMIEFALNNKSQDMLREGMFAAEILENDNCIASFNIYQRFAEMHTIDASGNSVTFLAPQDPPTSVNYFLEHDNGNISSYSMKKDIGRIVLNVFCNFDLDYSLFASSDPQYIERLQYLRDHLISGKYSVRVFGFKIFRFGPESITHLRPNGNFIPLKQYSKAIDSQDSSNVEQLYIPTVLILHKTVNNRRYIAYHNRMHYNLIGSGKPTALNQFNEQNIPMTLKTTQLIKL